MAKSRAAKETAIAEPERAGTPTVEQPHPATTLVGASDPGAAAVVSAHATSEVGPTLPEPSMDATTAAYRASAARPVTVSSVAVAW